MQTWFFIVLATKIVNQARGVTCHLSSKLTEQTSKNYIFHGGFVDDIDTLLGGGFKYFFYVHPYLGKILILTNIFQMG